MIARAALALVALVTLPATALAHGAQAYGSATATVVRPLTVTALAEMDFGTITHATGIAGTVTVSPGAAGATFAGGAGAVCSGSDCALAHAAAFRVDGEPLRSYQIALPATVVATGIAIGPGTSAPPLTISALQLGTAGGGTHARLDAGGSDRFEVGGTITLPADLGAARYHASFAVLVSYI